jgi:catechol 2,3-dioxygenase-like lactoylglutathione lyase family enzyme
VEQRISLITLGVADVRRSRTFYERLGWRGQEMEETVFFQAGGMALILWGRAKLAADSVGQRPEAGEPRSRRPETGAGRRGITPSGCRAG